MEEVNFEEVEGFDVPGALNGEKVEVPSGNEVNNSESVTEHVYVVFSENITIENGIKSIEDNVLSGAKLEVTRQDETGHAIVCVVNTADRKAIEQLSEVERVKVETTARPTDNNEKLSGEDNAQAGQNNEQSKKNYESEADSTQTNKSENASANESTENTKANKSENATAKESSENNSTDATNADSEEISSETASSVYDDSRNIGSKPSPFVGVTIVAVIAIAAIGAAIFFRKK